MVLLESHNLFLGTDVLLLEQQYLYLSTRKSIFWYVDDMCVCVRPAA